LKAAKSSGVGTNDLMEKEKNSGWEQLRNRFGNCNDDGVFCALTYNNIEFDAYLNFVHELFI